jgi:hypothetical protein
MIEGAGRYPQDQFPGQVDPRMLAFLHPDAARA